MNELKKENEKKMNSQILMDHVEPMTKKKW